MSNELTTINNNATLVDMRMDSKRFPRICSYSRENAVHEMSKIVAQAFLYKGQQADPTNVQFISCSLVDELVSDQDRLGTRYISFAEISRVVKRSVLGSDMYGISVASLYRVILDYIKGEGHKAQVEARDRKVKSDQESLKDSVIAPMLQAYTGQMIRRNK